MASHRASGTPLRRTPERLPGSAPSRVLANPTPSGEFPSRRELRAAERASGRASGRATRRAAGRGAHRAPEHVAGRAAGRAAHRASRPAVALTRRQLRELEIRRRRRALVVGRLPQVGVVGVLGLATIVAPLAGDVLPTTDGDAATSTAAAAAPAAAARTAFRVLPSVTDVVAVPEVLAVDTAEVPTAEELAAARERAERASRERERVALEQARLQEAVGDCDVANIDVGAANGRLRVRDLCELWGTGHLLRADAAVALAKLRFAYQDHFGEDLVITDSYRSYRSQVAVRARKPRLAAVPGTSEHGWGLAVDLAGGVQVADHRYRWLRENAPAFGWDNPDWARRGGAGPYEPWHWEYVAGQSAAD